MSVSKAQKFTDEQNELANLAKALAHPARIAILEYLAKVDSCICGDIVEELPLAQATISQHLKELKKVNLITGTIEAPRICYCINKAQWAKAQTLVAAFFNKINQQVGCC